MQSITFLAALASFAALAAGNPTAKRATYPQIIAVTPEEVAAHTTPSTSSFQAQANAQTVGIYVCTDANGQGNCAYILNLPGACTTLTNTQFQDNISFVDPSGNTSGTPNASCTVYIDQNCSGKSEVISQAYGNLAVAGDPSFDNAISSFSCVVRA